MMKTLAATAEVRMLGGELGGLDDVLFDDVFGDGDELGVADLFLFAEAREFLGDDVEVGVDAGGEELLRGAVGVGAELTGEALGGGGVEDD